MAESSLLTNQPGVCIDKPGTTFKVTNMHWSGFITSSSSQVCFMVPFVPIKNGLQPTVTALSMTVRTVLGGYAKDANDDATSSVKPIADSDLYTIDMHNINYIGLQWNITAANKWVKVNDTSTVITNNTPVAGTISFTVEFN